MYAESESTRSISVLALHLTTVHLLAFYLPAMAGFSVGQIVVLEDARGFGDVRGVDYDPDRLELRHGDRGTVTEGGYTTRGNGRFTNVHWDRHIGRSIVETPMESYRLRAGTTPPRTMAFTVGQIVELDAWGFGEGALLQTGDRGTVVVGGRMNEFGAMAARVLWHRIGREADMVEHRLRVCTHLVDAPGRSHGTLDRGVTPAMATPSIVVVTPGIAAVMTAYAKKRRLLREHRRNMCVMDDVIQDNGLHEELEARMVDETGKSLEEENLRLRQENLQLRQEGRNLETFVSAARDMQAARAVTTDLERTRICREDLCVRLYRH